MGSEGEEVVMLDLWSSPYAMRVKIGLAEKGIEYTCKQEDLGNKSSLLIQMNPVHKSVPVLIHKDKPVCESLNILQYIDETWPDRSSLLPSDPYLRSQARFWADFVDNKIFPVAVKLLKAKIEELEIVKDEIIDVLKLVEEQIMEGQFFGSDKFNYVDIALVPLTSWFYTLEKFGGFNIEAHCPKIVAWAKRCQQRETVLRSLAEPHKVYEYAMDLKLNHRL